MKKKVFVFLFILMVFFVVSNLSFVSAEPFTVGLTTYSASKMYPTVDRAIAVGLTPTGAEDYYRLISTHFYIDCNSAHAKGVIWDDDGTVLFISGDIAGGNGAAWKVFTFGDSIYLVKDHLYYFGIVIDGAVDVYYDGSNSQTGHLDTTNSYSNPQVHSLAHNGFMAGYVTVEGYGLPTPTPSPSPSPSPTVASVYPNVDPFVSVPSYYMVLLVLFACVAVLAGLYVTFEREGENKGVALLFVLVGLVLFVVLIVGYFVGF